MTDHLDVAQAASNLAAIAARHQFGNATDAELEAAWGRLLALRWQGMDSAPMDGTRVLAWALRQGWEKDGPAMVVCAHRHFPDTKDECSPIAWMPLPPAPGAQE
jgi:hypothetical protein